MVKISVTDLGFEREEITVIISRLVEHLLDANPSLSITPDNIAYQLAKVFGIEIQLAQILIQQIYIQTNVHSASGVWLDIHGIEAGVERRKPSYATGYLNLRGAPDNSLIEQGFEFTTDNNKKYISYEQATLPEYYSYKKLDESDVEFADPIVNADLLEVGDNSLINIVNPALYTFDGIKTVSWNDYTAWNDLGTIEYFDIQPPKKSVLSDGENYIPNSDYSWWIKHNIYTIDASDNITLNRALVNYDNLVDGADDKIFYNNVWYITNGTVTHICEDIVSSLPTGLGLGNDGEKYLVGTIVYEWVWDSTLGAGTWQIQPNVLGNTLTSNNHAGKKWIWLSEWYDLDNMPTAITFDGFLTTPYASTAAGTYISSGDLSFTSKNKYTYATATTTWSTTIVEEFDKMQYNSEDYVYYNDNWDTYTPVANGNFVYFVFDSYVTININIRSDLIGTDGNTSQQTIINSITNTNYTVGNPFPITNGKDIELDESYRKRIIKAKRKHFVAWNIINKCLELDSVERCNVYQDVAMDYTTNLVWDSFNNVYYSDYTNDNYWGFTFYPGEGIATLKQVVIRGMYTSDGGNVNDLEVSLYAIGESTTPDEIDYTYITDKDPLKTVYFSTNNLTDPIPDLEQDIIIKLLWNRLERSSTYAIVFKQTDNNATNHWKFNIFPDTKPGTDPWRTQSFENGNDLEHTSAYHQFYGKTYYGSPSFTIVSKESDGYTFTEMKSDIDDLLDWEIGYGLAPACIQRNVEQAEAVYLNIETTIRIDDGYDFDLIEEVIKTTISEFLDSLDMGENVSYSKVENIILSVPGVNRAYSTSMSINNQTVITDNTSYDMLVDKNQYCILNTDNYDGGGWSLIGVTINQR